MSAETLMEEVKTVSLEKNELAPQEEPYAYKNFVNFNQSVYMVNQKAQNFTFENVLEATVCRLMPWWRWNQ